jgi:hypothetical protein
MQDAGKGRKGQKEECLILKKLIICVSRKVHLMPETFYS